MPEVGYFGTRADFDEAWKSFTLLETTSSPDGTWQFLPFPGGLLDQPEILMKNLILIANLVRMERNLPKARAGTVNDATE